LNAKVVRAVQKNERKNAQKLALVEASTKQKQSKQQEIEMLQGRGSILANIIKVVIIKQFRG